MDNILDEIEPEIFLTDQEIFTQIWTKPRMVFKFIHKSAYDKHVTILLILAGIASTFDRSMTKDFGESFSLIGILAIVIIVGALFGWISYYIYAAMISWTGKWLNGTQDTKSILRVLSYAMLPNIVGLLIVFVQLLLYGSDIFSSDDEMILGEDTTQIIFYYSLFFAQVVLSIWTIVLSVTAVSEIQQFSIAKALWNCVLPMLLILVPFLILVFLTMGFD